MMIKGRFVKARVHMIVHIKISGQKSIDMHIIWTLQVYLSALKLYAQRWHQGKN